MIEGRAVVLDTSVIIAAGIRDEALHAHAASIMRDVVLGALRPLIAPNVRFEVRSGLVGAARRGRIDWDRVRALLLEIDALELPAPRVTFGDDELLPLCRSLGVSWADAHHVHLALQLAAPLVTADLRLVRILAGSRVWVASIADRPMD
jgi:predicted nucleic acid-binding protein